MRYDLYFHDDFDGRASAAVFLAFMRSKGYSPGRYVPLNLEIKNRWIKTKLKNQSAAFDFPYNPSLAIWFDHHETSFIDPRWRRTFRKHRFHFWDPSYPSCCGFVLDVLRQRFRFNPPPNLRELGRWLDIIDGARFSSPRQALNLREPAIALMYFIEKHGVGKSALTWLIEKMSSSSLREIAADPRVRRALVSIRRSHARALKFYKKHLEIYGRVGFIDLTNQNGPDLRFVAPYYLEPHLLYSVSLRKSGRGLYKVSLSTNPWRRKESKINAALLMKRYGGGGHPGAGGSGVGTKKKIEKIAEELISYLQSKV